MNNKWITHSWWKWLCIALILLALVAGMLAGVPRREILNETIRNLYYHVTQWFAMMLLITIAFVQSIQILLVQRKAAAQLISNEAAKKIIEDKELITYSLLCSAFFLGIIGLLTGSLWAKFTWGSYWTPDPKLNGVAVGMFLYWAYFILRNSIQQDTRSRAVTTAVYHIFAYIMFMLLIMLMPRVMESLHPGNGDNPAFSKYDMDSQMRVIFYPAVIGFTLLGLWISTLLYRYYKLENDMDKQQNNISDPLI